MLTARHYIRICVMAPSILFSFFSFYSPYIVIWWLFAYIRLCLTVNCEICWCERSLHVRVRYKLYVVFIMPAASDPFFFRFDFFCYFWPIRHIFTYTVKFMCYARKKAEQKQFTIYNIKKTITYGRRLCLGFEKRKKKNGRKSKKRKWRLFNIVMFGV